MHSLFQKQLARARTADGSVDFARLSDMVSHAYSEADFDRRRTDHSIRMLVEELDHRAEHDAMTGLANRTRFANQLQKTIGQDSDNARTAVLFLDLDHFKEVNDTMGHPAGDELLRKVAKRLTETVGDQGLVARLGGDEFAVVQWRVASRQQAADLAQSIVRSISEPYDLDEKRTVIGVSVGIAMCPENGRAPNDLLRRADMALYSAKQTGRRTYCFFEREMDEALTSRKEIEADLRIAVANGNFQLHFQPIIEAATRRTRCFEALIRWNDPSRGLIGPAEFIPIAEATGLILPIGEWVIRNACAQARRFTRDVNTAINLSPVQIRSDGIVQTFERALTDTGLDPARLEVEITESVLLEEDPKTISTLRRLRSLGVRFALDDFGTGHSSLSYLQKFHFDKIKIDQSFCSRVNSDPVNAALVRAVASLGRDLGMDVVAEGVETAQQSEALIAEGCNHLQGYYHGRPQPADSFGSDEDAALAMAREALRKLKEASETPPAPDRKRLAG